MMAIERLNGQIKESVPGGERVAWLERFTLHARPIFQEHGLTIPEPLLIGVGMLDKKAIGRTYSPVLSSIAATEITVAPVYDDTVSVAGTLCHELIHASGIHGHRRDFAKAGRLLGLTGKPTSMGFDDGLPPWAAEIVSGIGDYPPGTLQHPPREKRQTARMLKVECEACGMIWRASRSALVGKRLTCPDADCQAPVAGPDAP